MSNNKIEAYKTNGIASQLHLIQNSLNLIEFKKHLNRFTQKGDSLLFLNDSVYMLLSNEFNHDDLINLMKETFILVLNEHCEARAIKSLPNNIQTISYTEFVNLSIHAKKIISW